MEDMILASLKGIRVLDLSGCCIEKLPEATDQMIHLHYLAFDSTSALLPETCSRLFNLQVVCMTSYRSETWNDIICKKGLDGCAPKNMSSLNNLSHVYLLNREPIEITGHYKIPQFHGDGVFSLNHGNKLEDIKDIGFHGDLVIQELENVSSKQDALKAQICRNEHMKSLLLAWGSTIVTSELTDDDVLEVLQPPSNLSSLKVSGYRGSKFPFWLKSNYNNYLTSLRYLCLENCCKLRELPPLGQLPRLEELQLSKLNAVEEISPEFYGTKDASGSPCLKCLKLVDMQNLVDWSMPECRSLFPLLEEVFITKCSKLRRVPNIFPVTKDYKLLFLNNIELEFVFVTAPTSSSREQDDIVKKLRIMETEWRDTCLIWKVTDYSGFKLVSCDTNIESLFEEQKCKLEILDFHSHPEAIKDLYFFNCRPPLLKVGFTKLSSLERLTIEDDYAEDDDAEEEDDDAEDDVEEEDDDREEEDDDAEDDVEEEDDAEEEDDDAEEEDDDREEEDDVAEVKTDLRWLTSLTELRIKNTKYVKGINGLEALTCLTTMEIIGIPRLSLTHEFLMPLSSLSTLKIGVLNFEYFEDETLDLQNSRGLKVLHITHCDGLLELVNCNALTSLIELVIDHCPGLIIVPADFHFLNSSHNLELKLNDWVPFVTCKSLGLSDSFRTRQISRLIYTNSGALLALDSNDMDLVSKWPRNEWIPSEKANVLTLKRLNVEKGGER